MSTPDPKPSEGSTLPSDPRVIEAYAIGETATAKVAAAYSRGFEAGAEAERAKVVAWLRTSGLSKYTQGLVIEAIEREAHAEPAPKGESE